jgi:hypothetical protein
MIGDEDARFGVHDQHRNLGAFQKLLQGHRAVPLGEEVLTTIGADPMGNLLGLAFTRAAKAGVAPGTNHAYPHVEQTRFHSPTHADTPPST